MTVVTEVVIMTSFSKKNTLTPLQPTNSQGSFSQLLQYFFFKYTILLINLECPTMNMKNNANESNRPRLARDKPIISRWTFFIINQSTVHKV